MVARGKLSLLAAPPGALKSWLALFLARACARGETFLGQPARQCRVLVLDEENGPQELRRRYLERLGGGPNDGVLFSSMRRVRRTDPAWARTVLKRCREEAADLVIGDSLRRLAGSKIPPRGADIARREALIRARVTQVLALPRLAPAIQEHVLSLPKTDHRPVVTERALRPIAQLDDHEEQRAAFSMLLDFELSSEGAMEPR